MAERKNLDGLTLTQHHGITILALEAMEIWDGADLSLLRDGLNHVILQQGERSLAVDMSAVKYVPSGFFGMLFDWFERGVSVRLLAPQERVCNMLWFKQFFKPESDGWFVLYDSHLDSESVEDKDTDSWQEEEWDDQVEATVTADH